jgi:dTDP-4-amino-4,6-dideoxygalactose transaminase
VSSGTDALVCALQALGCEPGDEVVLPAFSFFATVEAVCRLGLLPRFVDVELSACGMDPDAAHAAIGPRTRALLAVHLYGCPVGLERLTSLAEQSGVALVEDAAQAFGARYAGKAAGTWGRVGCFSFFPTKPLGGLGDGGMLLTNEAELGARCRRLRVHGAAGKHEHLELGGNWRLDAVQAALLRVKLPHVERWRLARQQHVETYRAALREVDELVLPELPEAAESAHALFTVRVQGGARDALKSHLAKHGVRSAIYYPRTLPTQPALAAFGYRQGQFPNAERLSQEVLSLPLFAEIERAELERVIEAVSSYFR